MSGYRRVNYYELCRLCTTSEGSKTYIFRDEGRRRQLQRKIQSCFPIQVLEDDSLPKIVCHDCLRKLESFFEFRESVVSAEGMLESYFTSLRFSEDFLKEGKVYVKNIEKDIPILSEEHHPGDEDLSVEKISVSTNAQVITEEHTTPVVVSNINGSNLQIISTGAVQARVQQYKCAMQMQPANVASTVVETSAETHYTYQQTPQNQNPNQIVEQTQSTQIQVQSQIQSQNHMSQVQQTLRQISQQTSNQTSQVNQQQQVHVTQESQSQITHQIQQLQREHREHFEKHRQMHLVDASKAQHILPDQPETHANNNVIIKCNVESEEEDTMQKVQVEKNEVTNQTTTFTTVQATPEVFLSLGFKDALAAQVTREDVKEYKDFKDDSLTRTAIGHISEFLRLRTVPDPLVTVNPQAISQTSTTRTLNCRDCGKTFASSAQLNGHTCAAQLISEVPEIGSKDEPQVNGSSFSCDICSKPFKRKEHLFQHRKLHTGERPYVCTTCSKAFSRKEHLVRHLVSHTGQKMHECELCGKSFSRKDNLHKHRKTHGVSGPYICETCGKSFVVKHYYLMHLTTHAPAGVDGVTCPDPLPYKCDICYKAFSVKQYLTTHKLKHRSKNAGGQQQLNNGQQQTQQQSQQQAQQQQVQTVVSSELANTNITNGNTGNGSVIEIQNVVDRNEQQNETFNSNHYQENISQFQ